MNETDDDLDREKRSKEIEKLAIDIESAKREHLKKQKEIEKLNIDINNAQKNFRLEQIKAWAALLAPAITAITVLGTVYLGFFQTSSKSNADEDVNWRQTIAAIDSATAGAQRHVGTLLKPFLEWSSRYRTTAIGVTLDQLPKMRDVNTYRDLFNEAFPSPGPRDLQQILELDRSMNDELRTFYDANGVIKEAQSDERNIVIEEAAVLCKPIASILRDTNHKELLNKYLTLTKGSRPAIRLTNIYFEKCDFSDIDFTDVDLTDSTFDSVVLDDAIFGDDTPRSMYLWNAQIWWTSKFIGSKLLQYLISNFKPYQFHQDFVPSVSYPDGVVITREDWENNVRRLCKGAALHCSDDQVHSNFPAN